jgi:predicted DNA-binding transcriptional regulator
MKKIPQPSTTERQLIEKLVEKNPNDLSLSNGRNSDGYTPAQIYMVTVQNTESGRRIAEGLRKVLRHSGRTIRFRGRHSNRKGLLEKGLVGNTWSPQGYCDVRHVPHKISERFDIYVCADYHNDKRFQKS